MYTLAGSNLMSPSSSEKPISFFRFEPIAYFATLLEHFFDVTRARVPETNLLVFDEDGVPSRPSQTHLLQLSVHSAR